LGLLSALGIGLAILLAMTMPRPLNLLGCAASLATFGMMAFLATHNDYRWVELDHEILRAKHFYTGRIIERPVNGIEYLGMIVRPVRRSETVAVEALLRRAKGVEIRFRDRRTPLRILRSNPAMTNARELIEALLFRMAEIREVEPEIIDIAGKPLQCNIHWKGEKPKIVSDTLLKVRLTCLAFLGLMAGSLQGAAGLQKQRLQVLGSVPPREVRLQTLIETGPGTNPHVTVTDFDFGGYATDDTTAWIALFPLSATGATDAPPTEPVAQGSEIKAILRCSKIADDAALRAVLRKERVTGLCSDVQTGFRSTLKSNLIKVNPGCRLGSVWEIEQLESPPSAESVRTTFVHSALCFGLAAVVVLFGIARMRSSYRTTVPAG